MQARGPLMIEHRLIERMISVIHGTLAQVEKTRDLNPSFVDTAVDFIRIYADRTHHGKEEEILFEQLKARDLSATDQRIMQELIEEHVFARSITKDIVEANSQYRSGDTAALALVISNMRKLAEFYPAHIEKEDRIFFPAARAYFSEEEDQAMLAEFWEFDRQMIHEKYEAVVKGLE